MICDICHKGPYNYYFKNGAYIPTETHPITKLLCHSKCAKIHPQGKSFHIMHNRQVSLSTIRACLTLAIKELPLDIVKEIASYIRPLKGLEKVIYIHSIKRKFS